MKKFKTIQEAIEYIKNIHENILEFDIEEEWIDIAKDYHRSGKIYIEQVEEEDDLI